MKKALQQFEYLFFELRAMNNTRWWRWLSCWFSSSFWAIAFYRIDRFCYLLFGRGWSVFRIFLSPLLFLLRPWIGYCEIHYRADIGKGLLILHPTLGIVVSGKAVCGQNLTLTGGNCIGGKPGVREGDIILGNGVSMGANAVVLGPVRIGNNVAIGAGAVVVMDVGDDETVVGVPAKPITRQKSVEF
jgi:serine O-acetyltransferase